jgi:hypothetical protein
MTVPADPSFSVRSDADERTPVTLRSGQKLSPLMRAALDNGVSFDDVFAYAEAAARAKPLELESVIDPLQRELDIALFESFHAREPRKSVLFWKGAGL